MKITLTVCYNNYSVLEKSIDRYYEFCYYKPDIHFLVDNEYPLNKSRVKEVLKKISNKYGCVILEPNLNLGIKDGSNWALDHLSLQDEDKIILYDSNAYPLTKHFDKALIDLLENNKDVVGACLTRKNINDLEKIKDKYTNYYYYEDTDYFFGSSVGIFNYFIHKQFKFDMDLFNKYYGDVVNVHQAKLKKRAQKMNKRVLFLSDFHEDLNFYRVQEDIDYVNYKKIVGLLSYKDFSLEDYILNKDKYNKLSSVNNIIKKTNGLILN